MPEKVGCGFTRKAGCVFLGIYFSFVFCLGGGFIFKNTIHIHTQQQLMMAAVAAAGGVVALSPSPSPSEGTLRMCVICNGSKQQQLYSSDSSDSSDTYTTTVCLERETARCILGCTTTATKLMLQQFVRSVHNCEPLYVQHEALAKVRAAASDASSLDEVSRLLHAIATQPYITLVLTACGFLEITWPHIPDPALCARPLRMRSHFRDGWVAWLQYLAAMQRCLEHLGTRFVKCPSLVAAIDFLDAVPSPALPLSPAPALAPCTGTARTAHLSLWACDALSGGSSQLCKGLLCTMQSLEALHAQQAAAEAVVWFTETVPWDFNGRLVTIGDGQVTRLQAMGVDINVAADGTAAMYVRRTSCGRGACIALVTHKHGMGGMGTHSRTVLEDALRLLSVRKSSIGSVEFLW